MVEMKVPLPSDSGGFVRRECPYCYKQFKLKGEDIMNFTGNELYCPYCGKNASGDKWFTQEQAEYLQAHAKNLATKMISDKLNSEMERQLRGNKYVTFKANKVSLDEPHISPEPNDMKVLNLKCCNLHIKIEDGYIGTIYCPYCSLIH